MSTSQPTWTDKSTGVVRRVKGVILRIPWINSVARYVAQKVRDAQVTGTASYWSRGIATATPQALAPTASSGSSKPR